MFYVIPVYKCKRRRLSQYIKVVVYKGGGMVRGCAGSPSELTLVTLLTSQGNVLTRTTHKAARGVRLYLLMRSDFVLES